MDMDARKLAEARRVLGARTDTEAVDRALDHVICQERVFAALDRLAELGGLDDVFARAGSSRRGTRRGARRATSW
jgi:hypothetical protein